MYTLAFSVIVGLLAAFDKGVEAFTWFTFFSGFFATFVALTWLQSELGLDGAPAKKKKKKNEYLDDEWRVYEQHNQKRQMERLENGGYDKDMLPRKDDF